MVIVPPLHKGTVIDWLSTGKGPISTGTSAVMA